MATRVVNEETLSLLDGREVTVRPLNIKTLRKFMAVVSKFSDVEDESASLDLMVEAVQVALSRTAEDIADDVDYLEENLDMNTINRIMEICGGVDVSGDPNQTKAG
jgi:hypothetical protein